MRGIKLTIVLKQKFPVGAMVPLAPPTGTHDRTSRCRRVSDRYRLLGRHA
jgi:hypothetical protein